MAPRLQAMARPIAMPRAPRPRPGARPAGADAAVHPDFELAADPGNDGGSAAMEPGAVELAAAVVADDDGVAPAWRRVRRLSVSMMP